MLYILRDYYLIVGIGILLTEMFIWTTTNKGRELIEELFEREGWWLFLILIIMFCIAWPYIVRRMYLEERDEENVGYTD